jgi:hypothetical protein
MKSPRFVFPALLGCIIIGLTIYIFKLEHEITARADKEYEIISNKEDSISLITLDSIPLAQSSTLDSISLTKLSTVKSTIGNYINNYNRFDVDTAAGLSLSSIALEDKARSLQKKLIATLPNFSIVTGAGEDKVTRQYYIVEGDNKLDRDELYYYCLDRLRAKNKSIDIKDKLKSRKLTLALSRNGEESVWPHGIVLKYCILRNSFSSKAVYDSVVKNMRDATNEWMRTCNIKFQHASNLDRSDIDLDSYSESNQVLFVVRQIDVNGKFIAQAFYPSDPPYERLLLLDNSFFSSAYSKTGVLRHELGHIIGFRHEHIWSEDDSCKGEDIIQDELGAHPITTYDPYSVMHYPCGPNNGNFAIGLTAFDKDGAQKIYPFAK